MTAGCKGGRMMGPRQAIEAAVLCLLVLFPLGSGYLFSDFYVALVLRILIFGVLILGFDLLAGYCGLTSFGHAMFFGTGAYCAALVWKHVSDSVWLGILAGLGLNAVIGYVLGFLCVRTRTVYFVFLTLAFSQFFYVAADSWRLIGGTDGIAGIPFPTLVPGVRLEHRSAVYYFALAFLLLAYRVARRIVQSHFGRALIGVHQNEERIRFLGYNPSVLIRRTFLISGLFGSVSGSLMVCFQPYVPPTYYHVGMSASFMIMALLGGTGTLVGPLLGTAIVIVLGDVLSSWFKEAWTLCLGVLYILCVLYSPGGIAQIAANPRVAGVIARLSGRRGKGVDLDGI
ncbi:MAG: branched-chain amino acid ABC transporter permease [Thermodesulfobacteriota bacterium]